MGESQNNVTGCNSRNKTWSILPPIFPTSVFGNLNMGNEEIATKIYEDFLRESKLIVQELIDELSSLGADGHRITYETIIKDMGFYEACNNYINIEQEHRLHSLLSHLIEALNLVKKYGIEVENTEVKNTEAKNNSVDKVKTYEIFDKIEIYKILLNFSINIYGLVKSNIRKYRKGLNGKQKGLIIKGFSDIEVDGKNFYKIRWDYSTELNKLLIDSIKYHDTSLTTAINKRLKCDGYGEQLEYDVNNNKKGDNCDKDLIEYENKLIRIQNLYMPLVEEYYNKNGNEGKDFGSEGYKIGNEGFAHMKEILAYLIKTLNERIKNKNSENGTPVKIYKDSQNLQDLDLNDEVSKLKKIKELLDKWENINENYTIYLMRFLVSSHKDIDDMIDEASKKYDNFSSNMLKLFHKFDSLIGLFKDTNYREFIIYNSYPTEYFNSWKPAYNNDTTDTTSDNNTNSRNVNITEEANNKLEKYNKKNSVTYTDFHTNLGNLEDSPFDFDKINGTIGNMKDITNIIKSFIENRYFVDGDWGNDINYKLIIERYIEGIVDIYNQIIDKKDKYEYQNKIFEANLKELRSGIIDLINKYGKISGTYKELKDTGDLSKIILKITLIGKTSKLLRKTADGLNKLFKNVPSFSGIINQPPEIDDKEIMINNTIDIINNTFINGDKNSINGAKNSTDIDKNNTNGFYYSVKLLSDSLFGLKKSNKNISNICQCCNEIISMGDNIKFENIMDFITSIVKEKKEIEDSGNNDIDQNFVSFSFNNFYNNIIQNWRNATSKDLVNYGGSASILDDKKYLVIFNEALKESIISEENFAKIMVILGMSITKFESDNKIDNQGLEYLKAANRILYLYIPMIDEIFEEHSEEKLKLSEIIKKIVNRLESSLDSGKFGKDSSNLEKLSDYFESEEDFNSEINRLKSILSENKECERGKNTSNEGLVSLLYPTNPLQDCEISIEDIYRNIIHNPIQVESLPINELKNIFTDFVNKIKEKIKKQKNNDAYNSGEDSISKYYQAIIKYIDYIALNYRNNSEKYKKDLQDLIKDITDIYNNQIPNEMNSVYGSISNVDEALKKDLQELRDAVERSIYKLFHLTKGFYFKTKFTDESGKFTEISLPSNGEILIDKFKSRILDAIVIGVGAITSLVLRVLNSTDGDKTNK